MDARISRLAKSESDGSTANAIKVQHVYRRIGDYNVTLTLTRNGANRSETGAFLIGADGASSARMRRAAALM